MREIKPVALVEGDDALRFQMATAIVLAAAGEAGLPDVRTVTICANAIALVIASMFENEADAIEACERLIDDLRQMIPIHYRQLHPERRGDH